MCDFDQLNVLELFLDCITEPNEKLVKFGVGGIYNSCTGMSNNANIFCYYLNMMITASVFLNSEAV